MQGPTEAKEDNDVNIWIYGAYDAWYFGMDNN